MCRYEEETLKEPVGLQKTCPQGCTIFIAVYIYIYTVSWAIFILKFLKPTIETTPPRPHHQHQKNPQRPATQYWLACAQPPNERLDAAWRPPTPGTWPRSDAPHRGSSCFRISTASEGTAAPHRVKRGMNSTNGLFRTLQTQVQPSLISCIFWGDWELMGIACMRCEHLACTWSLSHALRDSRTPRSSVQPRLQVRRQRNWLECRRLINQTPV